MSDQRQPHPDSQRVALTPKGDGVFVFTPCCGTRVFFSLDQAVPGATLQTVCPPDGLERVVQLVGDDQAECGLRPVWAETTPTPRPGAGVDPGPGR